ncbi:hypothetical protein [Crassaminicella profunda]|uniref:hypothetical protein n=1 Tax=Crassaminicella profunda TaxID=1286698 RepID=UPI001CA6C7B7|nr:hypothetical protein [Crassaminicella profunda]QZY56636.1 hypothetical protein K7H06_06875 [Crassaminicella profunda]
MAFISETVIYIVILGLLVGGIILISKKNYSGLKVMLLGINITLFGGIIAVDPNSNLGGIEYLIAFLGLICSIMGISKND